MSFALDSKGVQRIMLANHQNFFYTIFFHLCDNVSYIGGTSSTWRELRRGVSFLVSCCTTPTGCSPGPFFKYDSRFIARLGLLPLASALCSSGLTTANAPVDSAEPYASRSFALSRCAGIPPIEDEFVIEREPPEPVMEGEDRPCMLLC